MSDKMVVNQCIKIQRKPNLCQKLRKLPKDQLDVMFDCTRHVKCEKLLGGKNQPTPYMGGTYFKGIEQVTRENIHSNGEVSPTSFKASCLNSKQVTRPNNHGSTGKASPTGFKTACFSTNN